MYKDGRGVSKDIGKAALLMQQASIAGNLDAMVEFAIAQFNGAGIDKDEATAARLFLKAAHLGNPVAQNRLARILMAGRGMPADATEAVKWHLIAKAGGNSDPDLDVFAAKQTPAVRETADAAAKKWLSTAAPVRP
jgi:TPR repeat protein